MRNTFALIAAVLLPATSAVADELILISGTQQFTGEVGAVASGGSPLNFDSFNLANNLAESWSPPAQDILASLASNTRARLTTTFQSIVEPGQIFVRNQTTEAFCARNANEGAWFAYDNTFVVRFEVLAPSDATVTASLTREHLFGWSSGQPCRITFGPENGTPIVDVSYDGGVPPFPWVDEFPSTTMTLMPGIVYRVELRNFNTWSAGFGSGYRDNLFFDLTLVDPPPHCPGDLNFDNQVNNADLTIMLGSFGREVTPGLWGDFNEDGIVNGADLSILLANFGESCE